MTIGCSVLPPAFRARIDGAVMRRPGTGDGVARLVAVSMVKVDMARRITRLSARAQKEVGRPEEFQLDKRFVASQARFTDNRQH